MHPGIFSLVVADCQADVMCPLSARLARGDRSPCGVGVGDALAAFTRHGVAAAQEMSPRARRLNVDVFEAGYYRP
jgi:hypothetical protein